MSSYSAFRASGNPALAYPLSEPTISAAPGLGVVPTGPASINTKGGYTTMIASTTRRSRSLYLMLSPNSGASAFHLVDIAVGAAGSEVVILSNLPFVHLSSLQNWMGHWTFPVDIPAGSRVSVRIQSSVASLGISVSAILTDRPHFQPGIVGRTETYGISTATSRATLMDPGGTVNTKGAWYQLTAATTADIYLLSAYHTDGGNHTNGYWFSFDIGVGAAGFEAVVVPDISAARGGTATGLQMWPATSGPYSVNIPAGSRISARLSCTGNNAADRLSEFAVLGSR